MVRASEAVETLAPPPVKAICAAPADDSRRDVAFAVFFLRIDSVAMPINPKRSH